MKKPERGWVLLHELHLLPLHWLNLSSSGRLLLVAFSYVLGIGGLWLFFPPTHDGSTMFLPIIFSCWLFRYRGLVASILLNGVAFQITYYLLLRGMLPDSAFVEGALIGVSTSLLIGLVVCWLRAALDEVRIARQQAQESERARALTEQRELQALLAYEQERKVNALKDQFLLNVNHELRTPLTVLAGFLDLLSVHHEDLAPQTRADMLKQAQESQEELALLIDQMLDATAVMGEIPLVEPEFVHVRDLLQQVLAMFIPGRLAAYTLRLQVNEQATVWADPQLLKQVLRNLLSNICKYVPPQTEICIEATQADASSSLCLSVQDAGPGIPADEQPHLFEKFVRLKRDQAGSVRGTGLGLYLCRRFVEGMGGHIWVESSGRPGEGSRFCLILPVSP
jgi:signal transduction histidine kinase